MIFKTISNYDGVPEQLMDKFKEIEQCNCNILSCIEEFVDDVLSHQDLHVSNMCVAIYKLYDDIKSKINECNKQITSYNLTVWERGLHFQDPPARILEKIPVEYKKEN
jgi:hypothetical protein